MVREREREREQTDRQREGVRVNKTDVILGNLYVVRGSVQTGSGGHNISRVFQWHELDPCALWPSLGRLQQSQYSRQVMFRRGVSVLMDEGNYRVNNNKNKAEREREADRQRE